MLVYCPLRPEDPRAEPEAIAGILDLDWSGPLAVVFGKEDRRRNPGDELDANRNITAKYNAARELALAGGFDALLTIEADMLVPPDALERLSQVDADVAYGLYVSRHGRHPWLTLSRVTEEVQGSQGMGETWQERSAMWDQVVETAGVGLGCTLIRRPVLERITFRCEDQYIANDWYFSIDVQAQGFTQMHDCGVRCGHIQGLQTFWPSVSTSHVITEKSVNIKEMIAMAKGKYVAVERLSMGDHDALPGEEVELDEAVAEVLLKQGAIKPAKPHAKAAAEKSKE